MNPPLGEQQPNSAKAKVETGPSTGRAQVGKGLRVNPQGLSFSPRGQVLLVICRIAKVLPTDSGSENIKMVLSGIDDVKVINIQACNVEWKVSEKT